jgi:hypothetical protein
MGVSKRLQAINGGWAWVGERKVLTSCTTRPGGPAENAYKQLWDLEPTEVMLSAGGVLAFIGSVVASIVAVRILGLRLWAQRRARSVV